MITSMWRYQQYYYYYEHTFRTALIRSCFLFLPCEREYKVYSTQTAMTDVVPRTCFLNLAYASQRKICFTCHWVGLHFLGGDELQNVSKTFPLKYYGRNNDPNILQMPTHSSPCYTAQVTQIVQRRVGTVLPSIKNKRKQAVVCGTGAWITGEL